MRRLAAIITLIAVAFSCTDDRVPLTRGPLGPARYEVTATASGGTVLPAERRRATLVVSELEDGASLTLRTASDEVIQTTLSRVEDGSLILERVRGATVGSAGETDLASLVGQLDPPLPSNPVRIGEVWSSTQRITTDTLSAEIRTELEIIRFRRIASTDAAELGGRITGRLSTTGESGALEGELVGTTRISWAVESGRVVAAETELTWTLPGGDIQLATSVKAT